MGHKPFGRGLAWRRDRYAWAGWVLVAGVFLGLPTLGITVLGLVHSQPNEVVAVKYRGKVECEDVISVSCFMSAYRWMSSPASAGFARR
jgi:hypothetical protein